MLNTTDGPRHIDPAPNRHVNISRAVEEDLTYVDELPEIVQVLNAAGWSATFEDGHQEELLFWCVLDDDTVHGVVLGEDGRINLVENNVEKLAGFVRYEQVVNNNMEEK